MTFEELREQASRIQPCNGVMEDFVGYLNFEISEIERARRAAAASREQHILQAVRRDQERTEAFQLGHQLLPSACWCMYGLDISLPAEGSEPLAESEPKYKYPPPGPLVRQLESTEAGCRLLLQKWALIHDCFGGKCNWIHKDVFDVIRLIGKRPLDAVDDPEVAVVFMAADALNRGHDNAFTALKQEIGFARAKDFMSRVSELASTRSAPFNPEQGRAMIIGIVEGAMNRLNALAEEHRRRANSDLAREAAGREFDSSPAAAELKRQEMMWIRSARRSIKFLLEEQRHSEQERAEGRAGGEGSRAPRAGRHGGATREHRLRGHTMWRGERTRKSPEACEGLGRRGRLIFPVGGRAVYAEVPWDRRN